MHIVMDESITQNSGFLNFIPSALQWEAGLGEGCWSWESCPQERTTPTYKVTMAMIHTFLPLCPLPWENMARQPSQDANTLNSEFIVSKTLRNKCLFFIKYPLSGTAGPYLQDSSACSHPQSTVIWKYSIPKINNSQILKYMSLWVPWGNFPVPCFICAGCELP